MKNLFLFIFSVLFISAGYTQQKKAPAKTPPRPPAVKLKNGLDSFSYAVGMSIAMQYKEFGVTTLNQNIVLAGCNDVLKKQPVRFTNDQANFVLNDYINKLMESKAGENKKAGATFLAANKTKPGVVTLPSGLQYVVIKQGSGPKPTLSDTVTVHYTGTLIEGLIFDSSIERGVPAKFTVSGVVPGWSEALQLMQVGSRWRMFLPAELGYGNYSPPGSQIPPGSVLIFDMELLSIGGQ